MPTLLISWNTKKRLPLVLLIAAALLGKGKEDTDDFELGIGAYSNKLAAATEALLTKAPTSAPTAPCNTIDCFYNSTFAFPMFSVSHDISNSGNGNGGGGSGSKEEDSGVGDRGRPMHPCLELTMEAVTEAVGLSNGSKELYFEALRNLTGTSLTAKPFTHSGTHLTTTVDSSSVESDSGFRFIDDSSSSGGSSGSSSNVLFVGDSIVNELLSSYRRITTTATVDSTTTTAATTAASVLSMLRATPLHGNAEKTKLMVLEKLLAMANPPQDHNDNNRNKKSRSSNSGGEDSGSTTNRNVGGNRNTGGGGTTFDMVIAGGLGLWHLADMPCVSDPNSPTALHRKIVHEHLLVYQALSAELGIPFVFVGSVPVDSAVVLLSPAKHDWHSFHDFSLMDAWDAVETGLFKEHDYGPGVLHFRPSLVTRRCPGVRCDGIHFGSDYWPEFAWDLKDASSSSDGGVRNGGKETKVTQYRCHSSEGIWDYPLASFLAQASQEWKEKGR